MERKEYKYDSRFSKQTNQSFKIIHDIYEDCKLILGAEKHLDWIDGGVSPKPTDDMLHNFNEYLKSYINEENAGILRTLLIIAKPYKDNMIVKENIDILSVKLREKSHNGSI